MTMQCIHADRQQKITNKQTNKQAVKQTKGHNIVMLKNVNAKSKRKIIPNRFGFRFLFFTLCDIPINCSEKKAQHIFFLVFPMLNLFVFFFFKLINILKLW
jgi:hypothetical protein